MEVGVRQAKSSLSKLIETALSGEQVVITSRGKPVVQLMPVKPKPDRNRGRGCLKGLPDVKLYPGWDSPETEAEIAALFKALSE